MEEVKHGIAALREQVNDLICAATEAVDEEPEFECLFLEILDNLDEIGEIVASMEEISEADPEDF